MNYEDTIESAREGLRRWLVKYTECTLQEGWPCGTCACALLADLGLEASCDEYTKHNEPVDRVNEVWRAILQIRESKPTELSQIAATRH